MLEAVRAGTIFAHDQKQYGRWQRRRARTGRAPRTTARDVMEQASLERHIAALAATHPEYVVIN